MEATFKFLFVMAVLLFALISVGVFLLIIRVTLMFTPVAHVLGLAITAL